MRDGKTHNIPTVITTDTPILVCIDNLRLHMLLCGNTRGARPVARLIVTDVMSTHLSLGGA